MPIHQTQGITYITSEILDSYNIKHGFFMRHGGCSPQPWNSLNMATSVGDSRENVIENRNRIANILHIDRASFYDLWQVHSNHVVIADHPRKQTEEHIKADAIVSNQIGVSLLMLFADCVPIIFYDPERKVIASCHAGWKGTITAVAAETIKVLVAKFNCASENIIGVIGPAICRDHYQIGDDVASKIKTNFDFYEEILMFRDEKIFLDLPRSNKLILERCGLKTIESMDICTYLNKEDWYSHRGENGKTGRFASVITL